MVVRAIHLIECRQRIKVTTFSLNRTPSKSIRSNKWFQTFCVLHSTNAFKIAMDLFSNGSCFFFHLLRLILLAMSFRETSGFAHEDRYCAHGFHCFSFSPACKAIRKTNY